MPKTLLLADDSVTIQKVVGISFANEDIVLLTVDNGDDAVLRASEARPDIVLADVVMPGRNGYEVCEAIKSDPNLAGTPVLLLTGTFEAFDEARAQRAGADGHITKPFEAQALVDQVNALLAQAGASVAPVTPSEDVSTPATPVSPSADTAYDFFDDEVTEPGRETETSAETTLLGAPSPAFGPRGGEAFSFEEPGGELGDLARAETPVSSPPEEVSAARLFDDPSSDSPLAGLAPGADVDSPEAPAPAAPQSETRIMMDSEDSPSAVSFGSADPGVDPLDPSASHGSLLADDSRAGTFDLAMPGDAPEPPTDPEPLEARTVLTPLDGEAHPAPPIESVADPFSAPEEPAAADPFSPPAEPSAADPFAAPSDAFAAQNEPETFARQPEVDASEHFEAQGDDMGSGQEDVGDPLDELPGIGAAEPPMQRSANPALEADDPLAASAGEAPERSEWDGGLDDTGDGTVAFELGGPLSDVDPTDAAFDAVLDPTSGSDYDVSSSDLGSPLASLPAAAVDTRQELAPPQVEPDQSPLIRQEVRDAIEKIAWEAFGQVTETLVKEALERVERIAWEVVPQMTEALIREEIRKLKGGDSTDE